MNTPLFIRNAPTSAVVFLALEAGGPATGLTFASVTAGIKKSGAGAFTGFTLTALNFTELSDGFYEVDLAAGDTDTLGSLYLSFTGATITTTLLAGWVTTATSASPLPTPAFTPTTTAIYGYVYGVDGAPVANATVTARLTQQPTIIHPTTDGILVGSDFLSAQTDSTGFFTLTILTGASAEFVIPVANYRRTITVPAATANLFDIP